MNLEEEKNNQSNQPQFDDEKKGYHDNEEKVNNKMMLKSHAARLIACNGDCGSKIAQIINKCVTQGVISLHIISCVLVNCDTNT